MACSISNRSPVRVLNSGANEFWGLNQATIRLGLDYGVTDRLMIGIGRSSYQKTYDGFVKYKALRECDAGCTTPVTLAFVWAISINGIPQSTHGPIRRRSGSFYFSHRMAYSFQIRPGWEFSESVSFRGVAGITLAQKADDDYIATASVAPAV